jgi:hypothetical protein
VQKNNRGTIGGAGFGVSNIQEAGIDLLQWANDVFLRRVGVGEALRRLRKRRPWPRDDDVKSRLVLCVS